MKYIKKADIIFISIIFILIVILSLFLYTGNQESTTVVIEVEGEIYGKYPIDDYREIDINGTNTLTIDETGVYMSHADCSDQICLQHYKLTTNLGVIVCLPNEIIVHIEGPTESEVDIIS